MSTELTNGVVLVTSADPANTYFGTGFIILNDESGCRILTCAHVVSDVGGSEQVKADGKAAKVIAFSEEDGPDLAVLLVGTLLDKSLLSLRAAGKRDLGFRTAGFQMSTKKFLLRPLEGRLGEGVGLESRDKADRYKAWDLRIDGEYTLQPGYSGSPVVDKQSGEVVAVVSHRQGQGERGLAVSIEGLKTIWPTMPTDLVKESQIDASECRPSADIAREDYRGRSCSLTLPPSRRVPNPFGITGRITKLEDFFDREELLRQVFEELEKGSSISLVGEAQIGKSSVLSMVCTLGANRLTAPPNGFIYLDMQRIYDEDQFFAALCDKLGMTNSRGYSLERQLTNKRYVVCLDEIEKMRKDRFTSDAREELRGFANGPDAPLKLVIASRSPLSELFPDQKGMTSPLDNICVPMDVPPFSPKVARDFIAKRLGNSGMSFTAAEIDDLLAQSSCHPAKLGLAAAKLFNRYRFAQ